MLPTSPGCRLLTSTIGDQTLIRLGGDTIDLDETNTSSLRQGLQDLVSKGHHHLVLSLANVGFVTSATVEVLLSLHRGLKALGGHLCVCKLSPPVADVFAVLRLESVLDIRAAHDGL
jgi:anti-anti-sigma factor